MSEPNLHVGFDGSVEAREPVEPELEEVEVEEDRLPNDEPDDAAEIADALAALDEEPGAEIVELPEGHQALAVARLDSDGDDYVLRDHEGNEVDRFRADQPFGFVLEAGQTLTRG